jgi:hypothetical protein
MARKTKIAGAMEVLAKVRKDIGDERFRTDASGSLQCRMGRYTANAMHISEATINEARRRLLRGG